MSTATISTTEYGNLLRNQDKLATKVAFLESVLEGLAQDEVSGSYAKKLTRLSKSMDRGEGKRFKNYKTFESYLRSL